MPAYDPISLMGMLRKARHTPGSRAMAATTRIILHQTRGRADRLIALPRMAVKPHSNTHKWICQSALACAEAEVFRTRSRKASGFAKHAIVVIQGILPAFR